MPKSTPPRRRAVGTAALFTGAVLFAGLGIALLVTPHPDSAPKARQAPAPSTSPSRPPAPGGPLLPRQRPRRPSPRARCLPQARRPRGCPSPSPTQRNDSSWPGPATTPGLARTRPTARPPSALPPRPPRSSPRNCVAGREAPAPTSGSSGRPRGPVSPRTSPGSAFRTERPPPPATRLTHGCSTRSSSPPETGPAITRPQQVALKLSRSSDSRWRAAGMPNV